MRVTVKKQDIPKDKIVKGEKGSYANITILNFDSDDEYASINCNWMISCEPLFGDVPRMDEIIGFDDQVKEIINSHKK